MVRRFISLRAKLILLCVLSIALPFAVVGSYTYAEYSARVEARSRMDSERLLRQIAIGAERYLKTIDDLSLAPLYDGELIALLKRRALSGRATAGPYATAELTTILRFFTALRFDRNEVRGVTLNLMDGSRFANTDYFAQDGWIVEATPWIARSRAAKGAARILGASGDDGLFSLVRQLREPFTHAELGFIKVDFSAVNLERAIFPTLAEQRDYILIIYNAQEELIYPRSLSPMAFMGRRNLIEFEGTDYIASAYRSEPSGLSFYGLVPYAEVSRDAQTLTSASVLIAAVSLVLACILAVLMADRIVSPLRRLAERMASVRDGRFDTRAEATTHDEVGELAEDFNVMAAEIQRLINEVYRVNLKEQEAEILLLQSQINPHFLYNTLETISMMAVERDRLDISDTVTKLGKMFRYSSAGTANRVPLVSELAFAENYMAIQALRLGNRIAFEVAVPEGFYRCLVPKLSIQPFVENVIDHGLEERPVRIRVTARQEGGDLVVSIRDDGKGLTASSAAALETRIRSPDEENAAPAPFGSIRRGVALRNIHHRIALLHGPLYGVSAFAEKGGGALFELRVPREDLA